MTVETEVSRNDYIGTGLLDTYDYDFKIYDESDLYVTVRDTNGGLTEPAYSVTGVGNENGGTITLTGGVLATGYALSVRFRTALRQETDIRNQGRYSPEVVEDALDRLVKIDQQQQDEINRSLKAPDTDSDFDMTLPAAAARASKVLGFDAQGARALYSTIPGAATAETVTYTPPWTGALPQVLHKRLIDECTPFDFMDASEQADVIARTAQTDFADAFDATTVMQKFADALDVGETYRVRVPGRIQAGAWKLTDTIDIPPWHVQGAGRGTTSFHTNFAGAVFKTKDYSARIWDLVFGDLSIYLAHNDSIGIWLQRSISHEVYRVSLEGPAGTGNRSKAIIIESDDQDSFYGIVQSVLANHIWRAVELTGAPTQLSQQKIIDLRHYGDYDTVNEPSLPGQSVYFAETTAGNGSGTAIIGGYFEHVEQAILTESGIFHCSGGTNFEANGNDLVFGSNALAGSSCDDAHGLTRAKVLNNSAHTFRIGPFYDDDNSLYIPTGKVVGAVSGTWTPALHQDGVDVSNVVYASRAGQYTKHDGLVTLSCQINLTSITNPAGGTFNYVDGLPFNPSGVDYQYIGNVHQDSIVASPIKSCGINVTSDANGRIYFLDADGDDINEDYIAGLLNFMITYRTDE